MSLIEVKLPFLPAADRVSVCEYFFFLLVFHTVNSWYAQLAKTCDFIEKYLMVFLFSSLILIVIYDILMMIVVWITCICWVKWCIKIIRTQVQTANSILITDVNEGCTASGRVGRGRHKAHDAIVRSTPKTDNYYE